MNSKKEISTKQEESLIRWDHGFTGDKVKISVCDTGRGNWVTRGRASTSKAGDCRAEYREKLILHLSHLMVRLYGCECFVVRRDASLLYVTVAAAPIPPAAEKTNGVKVPCSISLTLWSYPLRFSLSCLR